MSQRDKGDREEMEFIYDEFIKEIEIIVRKQNGQQYKGISKTLSGIEDRIKEHITLEINKNFNSICDAIEETVKYLDDKKGD